MKLLLDTHIWLWALTGSDRLTPAVRDALGSSDNEIWLSPISVWEAHLLAERGRIRVPGSVKDWIEQMVRRVPRREAVLTSEIAIASRTFAWSHQDPADRFLAATALVLGLTLVTADAKLAAATEFAVLANIP